MHRVDVILDSTLRVKFLITDQTSVFSSFKFALKTDKMQENLINNLSLMTI